MNKATCLALLAWMGGLFAHGEGPVATTRWVEKLDPPRLELEVRWNAAVKLTGFTARSGTQVLPAKFSPFDESDDGKAAVLFLIDKSDPKRARTIEAAKALSLQLIGGAGARAQCAIYAFDAKLVPVADWGTPVEGMAALLKPLRPTGLATELYRNVIEGAALLEKSPLRRRILVVLSDGKAEDTTYTLEQAVAAAAKAGVSVHGIGYAETPQGTVHLQSLRKLAADTGGVFAEADIGTKKLPAGFHAEFAPLLFNGGFATVDLKDVAGREVVCEWQGATLPPAQATVPLSITAPPPPAPKVDPPPRDPKVDEVAARVAEMAKQVAAVSQQVAAVPGKIEETAKKAEEAAKKTAEEARKADEDRRAAEKKEAEDKAAKELAFGAEMATKANELAEQEARAAAKKRSRLQTGAGLCFLVGLVAAIYFLGQRRKQREAAEAAAVFARLQLLDGDGTEHLMRTTALRIGRGKDNDLTLANDSVSRHHAEISRTPEGVFTITELNAGNGVLVNGQPVVKAELHHEDVIELGEVRIRFLIA